MNVSVWIRSWLIALLVVPAGVLAASSESPRDDARLDGWLNWRGPRQNGTSAETGLPDTIELGGAGHRWSYPLSGRGTPVMTAGRVYTLGYEGSGKDLHELLVCLDENGKKIWELRFNDFLSDVVYSRYSLGSPTIDAATGNVYALSSAGELSGVTPDGKILWQRSLMSEIGRMTFPNGRTGSPVIDGQNVIIHAITSNWGPEGPAADRFYAFDKTTGEIVWGCMPGTRPEDSSFSMPVLEWREGRRLLYAGTGCGNLICLDARTGDPVWRFAMATGGCNSAALLYGDSIIAVHGKENLDNSTIGRMISVKLGALPEPGQPAPRVLDKGFEQWRNDAVGAFSSSPILVGNRVYVTTSIGHLYSVDADTGKTLWHRQLAPDQIHASPLYADGKLYVPMNNGSFYIIRPRDDGPEMLCTLQLAGNCLGAPSVWNGQLYVHTTDRLYCFGNGEPRPAPPAPARLQVVPADVLVAQGQSVRFRVRGLDAQGNVVAERLPDVTWEAPPTLEVLFPSADEMRVPAGAPATAGMIKAKVGNLVAPVRLRIVPAPPYTEDFEALPFDKPNTDPPAGFPPSFWTSSRPKWEVVGQDGQKVLAKTLDNPLFQRCQCFFGAPEMSNYTMQVDIMSDGNRRSMSSAGLINQRYLIELKGNYQEIEVSSNMERIKENVPFHWTPKKWYTLKSRVDVAPDGSGVVRAKAWERGTTEPEAWSIEVNHARAHTQGSPGIYGFTPQSRFRVYIDNIVVTPNDD